MREATEGCFKLAVLRQQIEVMRKPYWAYQSAILSNRAAYGPFNQKYRYHAAQIVCEKPGTYLIHKMMLPNIQCLLGDLFIVGVRLAAKCAASLMRLISCRFLGSYPDCNSDDLSAPNKHWIHRNTALQFEAHVGHLTDELIKDGAHAVGRKGSPATQWARWLTWRSRWLQYLPNFLPLRGHSEAAVRNFLHPLSARIPINGRGNPRALSHLIFARAVVTPTPPDDNSVATPEPMSTAAFGLFAVGAFRVLKKKTGAES